MFGSIKKLVIYCNNLDRFWILAPMKHSLHLSKSSPVKALTLPLFFNYSQVLIGLIHQTFQLGILIMFVNALF